MSQINLQKQVFDKNTYERVVDTQFHEFLNSNNQTEAPYFSVEDFFQLYEDVFYQISKEGDVNSHQYILKKEADYLGISISQDDVQALLNEITSLRQQLLESQQIITDLTKK